MTLYIKALILLAAMALGAWGGYAWRDAEADKQMAFVEAQQAKRDADELRADLRHRQRIQEAQDAEQIRRVAAETALRRADAAGRGLRDELQATVAWARGLDSTLASERQAAGQAVAVLADLLGRCDSRRRELAEFADRAASAGQACQQSWPTDALSAAPEP